MKNILFLIGALAIGPSAYAADVSSDQILFGQPGSHSSGRSLEEGAQSWTFGGHAVDGIRILPRRQFTGNTFSLASTYQYGWDSSLTLGGSLATRKESTDEEVPGFQKSSSPHLQGEVFIRYRIWEDHRFQVLVTPFFETGFASSDHFSYGAKSRIGAILSTTIFHENLSLGVNGHYRFRPAEVHGEYRVASDYGFSIRPAIDLGMAGIWMEYSQLNTKILNINRPGNQYRDNISKAASLGAEISIADDKLMGASYSRGITLDQVGTADHRFSVTLTMNIGSSSAPERATPPGPDMTPGQRIYWLDQLRKNMAQKNRKVGQEMKGFTLSEGTKTETRPENPAGQDIAEADDELKKLKRVDKRIKAKGQKLENNPTVNNQLKQEPAQLPINTTP